MISSNSSTEQTGETVPEAVAAGGSFAQWLRARHDDDPFEKEIADGVTEWFGN